MLLVVTAGTSYGLSSNPQPWGNFDKLTIPIKRAQNLLLIEATVDGQQGNFILDTGAPHLVLNKTYFRYGKLSEGTLSSGITGGSEPVYHTNIDTLSIQDLYFTSITADLSNLGHIEDSKGQKILGLLGANLFTNLELELDLQNNVLYLYKLDQNGSRVWTDSASSSSALHMNFEIQNDIIFLTGTSAGKKVKFCLDTGAETNVLNNSVGNKVLAQFHLTNRCTLAGSGTNKVNVLCGELSELTMSTHIFHNVPAILTSLSNLALVYNTSLDGILGYQFLSQGRVIINMKKKELTMYFYQEQK